MIEKLISWSINKAINQCLFQTTVFTHNLSLCTRLAARFTPKWAKSELNMKLLELSLQWRTGNESYVTKAHVATTKNSLNIEQECFQRMFETLQRHRLVTQRRWQTVPWCGTRRRKHAVTECDCLCPGDHQFVVVSWSQPGPASNRHDCHTESSEVRRRPIIDQSGNQSMFVSDNCLYT